MQLINSLDANPQLLLRSLLLPFHLLPLFYLFFHPDHARVEADRCVYYVLLRDPGQPVVVPRQRPVPLEGAGAHGGEADGERRGGAGRQGREQRALRLRVCQGGGVGRLKTQEVGDDGAGVEK